MVTDNRRKTELNQHYLTVQTLLFTNNNLNIKQNSFKFINSHERNHLLCVSTGTLNSP